MNDRLRIAALLASLAFVACGDSGGSSGGDGSSGPGDGTGPTTTATTTGETGSGEACGNQVVDPGEACDDGLNDGRYGGCEPGCGALAAFCGDATINGDEVCDDGQNDGSYDGCEPGCLALAGFCGDGDVQDPEGCDELDPNNEDGCNVDCTVSGSVLWEVTWPETDGGFSDQFVAVDDMGNSYGIFGEAPAVELVRFDNMGSEIGRSMVATGANNWWRLSIHSPSGSLRLAGSSASGGFRALVDGSAGQLQEFANETTVLSWREQCVGSDGRFALIGPLMANIAGPDPDWMIRVLDPSGSQLFEGSLPDIAVNDCAFLSDLRIAFMVSAVTNGITVTNGPNGLQGTLVVDDTDPTALWDRIEVTQLDTLVVAGESGFTSLPLLRAWTEAGQEVWDASSPLGSPTGSWRSLSVTGTDNLVVIGIGAVDAMRKYSGATGDLLWATSFPDGPDVIRSATEIASLPDGRVMAAGFASEDGGSTLERWIAQLAP